MNKNSKLMKIFIFFKLYNIAWSLRRVYCPVNKNDLVLEVGSGGSPYFRANILTDPYDDTVERFNVPLVQDRPLIYAYAEDLPFKNNAFDFVIASHVLEHSSDPEKFLNEIQRVGKAGYIEVPDAFMERLTAYPFHKLEIYEKNNTLFIKNKIDQIHDKEVVRLFRNNCQKIFPYWAKKFPFNFHVRYYWNKKDGGIKYKIINPKDKINWSFSEKKYSDITLDLKIQDRIKQFILKCIRIFFSQNKRNKSIDLSKIIMCKKCLSDSFVIENNMYICTKCKNNIKYSFPKAN